MVSAGMMIRYVNNPIRSAAFYSQLLKVQPCELHPTFALFVFETGFKLGLWSAFTAQPMPLSASSGQGELLFTVNSNDDVDRLYADWGMQHDITVIQKPTMLDFGYTWAMMDPDGHRLRLCCFQTE